MSIGASVKERLEEGDGHWFTCTGCHESEDGYDVGFYPFSKVFGCKIGSGCRECGGLGAIWDSTNYDDLIEEHEEALAIPPAERAGES
ncbi:MAG TPA: hypothetical protein VLC51_10045 [Nitrospira sp.]|nr:hypothetical protein [Nitrospira sp.]